MLVPAALAAPVCAQPGAGAAREPAQPSEDLQPPRRVVVDRFHGADAETARSEVLSALEQEDAVDVVGVQLLEAQAGALDGSAESYIELSRRLNLSAVVRGKIKRLSTEPKKPYLATLTVINGRDGQLIGKVSFSAGSVAALRARLSIQLWTELGPLIQKCASARQSEAAPLATPAPSGEGEVSEHRAEPARERQPLRSATEAAGSSGVSHKTEFSHVPALEVRPSAQRSAILELQASVGALQRTFDYRDEQRGALRAYLLHGAPSARFDANFYPFALSSRGAVAGLGLRVAFEPLLAVTSRLAERRLTTRAYAYQAELVWRLPLGPLAFAPALGFAERRYEVSESIVPEVAYESLRASVGLRLRAAWLVGELACGGRFVLDTGQLGSADWFPDVSGFGWDANAQLGVGIGDWLDLLLGGAAELYRWDFHAPSNATDPSMFPNGIAAGASDRYLQALFSVRFRVSKGWPAL
jgi:hypothetical protein